MEDVREQQVALSDYLRILSKNKWIIFFCFIIVVSATAYLTFTSPPVYEASALVLLKEEGRVERQIFNATSFIEKEKRINNHVEILQSRTLAESVIRRLMDSEQKDSLRILGNIPHEEHFSLKKWVYKTLKLNDKTNGKDDKPSFDDIVQSFREGAISVAPKRDTDLIELRVEANSPWEASVVANAWAKSYQEMDIHDTRGEVQEVLTFLKNKLDTVKAVLTGSEEILKDYKEKQSVTELSAETEQLIKQSAEFETMYQGAKTDLEANEKRLAHLKIQLDENQRGLLEEATSLSSPVIQELQKQMANLIGEIASYEQQLRGAGLYSDDDPKLNRMDQRLKGLQDKIMEETRKTVTSGLGAMNPLDFSESLLTSIVELESENKSLRAKTEALRKIVQDHDRALNALPEKSLKLARLQREATLNNSIYMMLREKYEENKIAEAGQIGSVRIVDNARPPKYPIRPKKKLNLILGAMIGLGLGLGISFIREYLDTSLKSIEDVERLGFTVLGSIPFIEPEKVNKHLHSKDREILKIASRLITHFAPKSPISEAYRSLRTNILYAKVDQPIKTVLVTSSGPGEGKSTSAANLAITFSQMGAKTLLIDTDLRRPVLHAIFSLPQTEGLTNYLIGNTHLEDAIKKSRIDNLSILTSGTLPPNPSELLASMKMDGFIDQVSSQYDMVLFDSPPIIPVTDAAVLAPKLDGTVLVVKSGETERDALLRSRVLFDNVNANVFGVLINGVNISHMQGSYYYYYYEYGDNKEGGKRKKHRAFSE